MYTFRNGYQRKTLQRHTKHEENLQLQVCNYLRARYPAVIFRSDYASGLHMTPYQAVRHQKLQSGRSWPDLFIYEPRNGHSGLAIELKRDGTTIYVSRGERKGQLTADTHIREQAALLDELTRRGYKALFCCGYREAVKAIDDYFGVSNTELF